MSNLIIVTGLSGSGKTTYCNNYYKEYLSFDSVFEYKNGGSLKYDILDEYLDKNNSKDIVLDAYNVQILKYIVNKCNIKNIIINFIYTDIEKYYFLYAACVDRILTLEKSTYDEHIKLIVHNQVAILDTIKNEILNKLNNEYLNPNNININIKYIYRNQSGFENPIIIPECLNKNSCEYVEYDNDTHFNNMYIDYLDNIDKNKEKYILNYVDNISGSKNYQSILLGNNYIRRGTEQDWITLDNILRCTELKNKVIMDIGCFNGYFSFMSALQGAKKVIGIDNNEPALKICNLLSIMNNYYEYKNGKLIKDNSCELGIHFYNKTIGIDNIFDNNIINDKIDLIFAFNMLHHVKNLVGYDAFIKIVDSLFKNCNEIIFEINDKELEDILQIGNDNRFILKNKIESHRKTMFGDRWVLYFNKII